MTHTPRLSLPSKAAMMVIAAYACIALGAWIGVIAGDWDRIGDAAYAAPSAEHWFGTNRNGQDIFERTLYATQSAFGVGLFAAIASTLLGCALGAIAGFGGRIADGVVSWIAGSFDSIPFYLLVVAMAYALQGQDWALPLAMVLSFWTGTARLLRAEVLRLQTQPYIEAARASGLQWRAILMSHLLPHCGHLLLTQGSLVFVAAIKTEVLLSFLGLGTGGGVSWGLMLAQAGQDIGAGHYANLLAATGALGVLSIAVGALASDLQRWLDPRSAE